MQTYSSLVLISETFCDFNFMKKLILLSLLALCILCSCDDASVMNSINIDNGNGNNTVVDNEKESTDGDNNNDCNDAEEYGDNISAPGITMKITSATETLEFGKIANISAIIIPHFNTGLGEYPVIITRTYVANGFNVPDFSTVSYNFCEKQDIYLEQNSCSTKNIILKNLQPGLIKQIDPPILIGQQTEPLCGPVDIKTGKKYRAETSFGVPYGIALEIIRYAAILDKKGNTIAKSENFYKTYTIQMENL